jgi:hypothetical protein
MKLVLAASVRIRESRSMHDDGYQEVLHQRGAGEIESDSRREAERIRALLRRTVEASGLSRRAVARAAEMSEAELDRVLRDAGDDFTLDQLHRILATAEVTTESFFFLPGGGLFAPWPPGRRGQGAATRGLRRAGAAQPCGVVGGGTGVLRHGRLAALRARLVGSRRSPRFLLRHRPLDACNGSLVTGASL